MAFKYQPTTERLQLLDKSTSEQILGLDRHGSRNICSHTRGHNNGKRVALPYRTLRPPETGKDDNIKPGQPPICGSNEPHLVGVNTPVLRMQLPISKRNHLSPLTPESRINVPRDSPLPSPASPDTLSTDGTSGGLSLRSKCYTDTPPSTCGSSRKEYGRIAGNGQSGGECIATTELESSGTPSKITVDSVSSYKESIVKKIQSHSNLSHTKQPTVAATAGGDRVAAPTAEQIANSSHGLAAIPEMAVCSTSPTVSTVERAAAAKVYLETQYNELLSGPSARSTRLHALEAALYNTKGLRNEEKEERRKAFHRAESNHLREIRAMKVAFSRSLSQGPKLEMAGPSSTTCVSDFEGLKVLGKGSFGVVRLVREKTPVGNEPAAENNMRTQVYAMKVIRKSQMLRSNQEGHLRAERDFLVASEGSSWSVLQALLAFLLIASAFPHKNDG